MPKRRSKPPVNGDFELRHWKSTRRPSNLKIPNGGSNKSKPDNEFDEIFEESDEEGDRGYVSLRDILTSPEYAAATSPIGGGGSCPEINIRNPLVMRAAYAYLQPTPSTREIAGKNRVEVRRILVQIFSPCFEFLGGIFNFRR